MLEPPVLEPPALELPEPWPAFAPGVPDLPADGRADAVVLELLGRADPGADAVVVGRDVWPVADGRAWWLPARDATATSATVTVISRPNRMISVRSR